MWSRKCHVGWEFVIQSWNVVIILKTLFRIPATRIHQSSLFCTAMLDWLLSVDQWFCTDVFVHNQRLSQSILLFVWSSPVEKSFCTAGWVGVVVFCLPAARISFVYLIVCKVPWHNSAIECYNLLCMFFDKVMPFIPSIWCHRLNNE